MLKQILLTSALLSAGICAAQDGTPNRFSRDYPEDNCRKAQKTSEAQAVPAHMPYLPLEIKGLIASFIGDPKETGELRLIDTEWKQAIEASRHTLEFFGFKSVSVGAYCLNGTQVNRMLQGFHHLHTLRLNRMEKNVNLNILAHMPLKRLAFKQSPIASTLGTLPALPHLESLELEKCQIINALNQDFFNKVSGLRSLKLINCLNIASGWQTRIGTLSSLEEFVFVQPMRNQNSNNTATRYTYPDQTEIDTLIHNLPRGLKSINLSGLDELDDDHMETVVKRFKGLTSLTLAECDIGFFGSLRKITALKLTSVNLYETQLSGNNLEYILQIPTLRHLNIRNSPFEEGTARLLLEHPGIETVLLPKDENYVTKETWDALCQRFGCENGYDSDLMGDEDEELSDEEDDQD